MVETTRDIAIATRAQVRVANRRLDALDDLAEDVATLKAYARVGGAIGAAALTAIAGLLIWLGTNRLPADRIDTSGTGIEQAVARR